MKFLIQIFSNFKLFLFLILFISFYLITGVITYRIAATQIYATVDNQPLINEYAKLMAAASGSIINLFVISILDVSE